VPNQSKDTELKRLTYGLFFKQYSTLAHIASRCQHTRNHSGIIRKFIALLTYGNIAEISATAATSFALIAAAEIGDKSQLVLHDFGIPDIEPCRFC